jgi:prepilin-type N-terminal cleavage/methylation domain-containing protein
MKVHHPAHHPASQAGFSMLELVIAVALSALLMGSISSLLLQSQRVYGAEQANADAQENARFAVLRLGEIIRGAGNNPASIQTFNPLTSTTVTNGGAAVTPGTAGNQITVFADYNGNGTFNDNIAASDNIISSENVTLRLAGTTIQMVDNTPGGVTNPVVQDIQSVSFTEAADRRSVTITVTARSPRAVPGDNRFRTASLTGVVRLRNRQ